MTNVHSRHIRRGRVGAPVVVMDHAEAVRLRQQQHEANWSGWPGALGALVLVVGGPIAVVALVGAAVWGATGAWVLPLVLVALAGLVGWAM